MKHIEEVTKKNVRILDGIELQLIREPRERAELNADMELYYVIAGRVEAVLSGGRFELLKKDVVVFNIGQGFYLTSDAESLALRVRYTGRRLAASIDDGNVFFQCNSALDRIHSYEELQQILTRIVMSFVGKRKHTDSLQTGLAYLLLDQLVEYFRDSDYGLVRHGKSGLDEQVRYMISYVSSHYRETIRMQELADSMYTSVSTLSRLFKRQTGTYFAEFVSLVRLEAAARELRETTKNVTAIAYDCGFTNSSSFNRNFLKAYGLSPRAYRREKLGEEQIDEAAAGWETIEQQIRSLDDGEAETETGRLAREIDAAGGAPYRHFWSEVLNIGSAHLLAMANMQSHVLYLKERLGFRYARVWNIFSPKLLIRRGEDDRNYNFSLLDDALDFLLGNGLIPFIDLGGRPDEALSSENENVYYEQGMMPFRDRRDWEMVLDAFLKHIVRRYGRKTAAAWRFEFFVYDRREFSFLEEAADWFELYAVCCRALRSKLPEAAIGGRGFMPDADPSEVLTWLTCCREQGVMPDFVSVTGFPYIRNREGDAVVVRRNPKLERSAELLLQLRAAMDEAGFSAVRLWMTEWNISLSNRNFLNDSCARAAFLIKSVFSIWDKPDLLAVWMASDWISAYYDTVGAANGGSGILTRDSIRKPVFYALQFLGQLERLVVARETDFIVTRDEDQSNYYVLAHNFRGFSPEYFLREEDSIAPDEIGTLFQDGRRLALELTLRNLPEGREYRIKQRTVSPSQGSLLSEWSRFHYEKELDGSDIRYLREVCIPGVRMLEGKRDGTALRFQAELEPQAVTMIHIYAMD